MFSLLFIIKFSFESFVIIFILFIEFKFVIPLNSCISSKFEISFIFISGITPVLPITFISERPTIGSLLAEAFISVEQDISPITGVLSIILVSSSLCCLIYNNI